MNHRRHSTRYAASTLAELNITPMLDLAFVLLVIFMISAPFLAERAELILPSSTVSREAIDPRNTVTVGAGAHGAFELKGEPLTLPALEDRLRELRAARPELSVVLQADHRLTLQQVTVVLDSLKRCGIADVGLVTRPGAGERE